MVKFFKGILVSVLMLFLMCTYVSAQTIEVGEGKSHLNINSALAVAIDGDTILVYPGEYSEHIDINVKNLTLKSVGGFSQTKIIGGGTSEVIKINSNLGKINVEGFTIVLSDTITNPNGITQGYASANGTQSIIKRNKIVAKKNMRNGIQVSGSNSEVIENIIEGAPLTSDWASTGIMVVNFNGYENAKKVLVKNNIITKADYGIAVIQWYEGGEVSGCVLDGNKIEKALYAGINIGGKVIDTNIINNNIKNNEVGILEDHDFYYGYGGGNPTGTKATHNEFCWNNIDIEVIGDNIEEIDARNNWWCSNAGPRKDKMIGKIRYTPWEKRNALPMEAILKILKKNRGEN